MLDDQARGLCEDFLNTVPCTAFAFAYGSAAFSQTSATTKNGDSSPMLDVIIFVNDVTEWHSEVRTQPPVFHALCTYVLPE